MTEFSVDLSEIRHLADEFKRIGQEVKTALNPIKQSGLEPPTERVLPGSEAVTGYSECSEQIAQSVVQLATSLSAISKKLDVVAANYEGADLGSVIYSNE